MSGADSDSSSSSSSSSSSASDDDDEAFKDAKEFKEFHIAGWLQRKQPGVTKKSSTAKKWKRRWFRTANQFLIFSAVKGATYQLDKAIELSDSSVQLGDKDTDFTLQALAEDPIVLRAETPELAKEWVKKLQGRIEAFDEYDVLLNEKAKEMAQALGSQSTDTTGVASDELSDTPEKGQNWIAVKTGLHIRSEPGGLEVGKLEEVQAQQCHCLPSF